jgi:hypothetical protein
LISRQSSGREARGQKPEARIAFAYAFSKRPTSSRRFMLPS